MGLDIKCLSHDDPDRLWEYCPSLGAAAAFAALFGAVTAAHIAQAFIHRKGFTWVLIMAGIWETTGYIFRILSITKQANVTFFTVQQLLILLAPLWINAFVYMTLGRLIHFFLRDDRLLKIRARRITLMFVLFDVAAFLVQGAGGTMTSGDVSMSTLKTGLRIYTGGVGLQLLFLTIFCAIAIRFHMRHANQDKTLSRDLALEPVGPYTNTYSPPQSKSDLTDVDFSQRTTRHARPIMITIWIVMALIVIRTIFRLIEYASTEKIESSTFMTHEYWVFVLDATPMFAAMLALSIYHPGRVLQGPRCDFKSEDKARKQEKRMKKAEKKAMKDGQTYMQVGDSAEQLA